MITALILSFFLQCGGCEALVQGDGDLDPSPDSYVSLTDFGSFGAISVLDVYDGTCGPDIGSTCSKQVTPAVFYLEYNAQLSPGVFFLINQGTSFPSYSWEIITSPVYLSTRRYSMPCDNDKFKRLEIMLYDSSTGQATRTFLDLFGKSCPLPD